MVVLTSRRYVIPVLLTRAGEEAVLMGGAAEMMRARGTETVTDGTVRDTTAADSATTDLEVGGSAATDQTEVEGVEVEAAVVEGVGEDTGRISQTEHVVSIHYTLLDVNTPHGFNMLPDYHGLSICQETHDILPVLVLCGQHKNSIDSRDVPSMLVDCWVLSKMFSRDLPNLGSKCRQRHRRWTNFGLTLCKNVVLLLCLLGCHHEFYFDFTLDQR